MGYLVTMLCYVFVLTVFLSTYDNHVYCGKTREKNTKETQDWDFTTTLRQKHLNINCCSRAEEVCARPCSGQQCSARCRVRCGWGGVYCEPVSCALANPGQCVFLPPVCEEGYTAVGTKCMKKMDGRRWRMGGYCMQGEDVLCLPEETEGQRTKRKDKDLVIFAILYLY